MVHDSVVRGGSRIAPSEAFLRALSREVRSRAARRWSFPLREVVKQDAFAEAAVAHRELIEAE